MSSDKANTTRPYRVSDVKLEIKETGGTLRNLTVETCAISTSHVIFETRAFCHTDSIVVIDLPKPDNSILRVQGLVRRCTLTHGNKHAVLVEFNELLELHLLIGASAFDTKNDKVKKGENGAGDDSRERVSVLYIDDQVADRVLMTHLLKDSHLDIVTADSTGNAYDRLKLDAFGVVLCDYHLEGLTGLDFLAQIRPDLHKGPVIFVTAETNETVFRSMIEAGAAGVLTKPLDVNRLASLIDSVLTEDAAKRDLAFDPFDAPPSDPKLAGRYIPMLSQYIDDFARAKAKRNVDLAKTVCRTVMGSASGFGFQRLSRTAERAFAAIDTANNIDLAGKPVVELATQMKTILEASSQAA